MNWTDSDVAEEYGTAELDDQGRVTIPESLRDALELDAGTEFTVVREGSNVRLVRQLPELETLTRDEDWDEDAFRDSGDATFGPR